MGFRLIAADLDYTLLDENSEISARNREAIQKAVARGVKFIIATGRTFKTSVAYMDALGLPCDWPLINYHGAMVKTARSGKVIDHRPLDNRLAIEVINKIHDQGLHISMFIGDHLYVREENEHTRYYQTLTNLELRAVGDLAQFLAHKKVNPTKLSVISWDGRIDQVEPNLKASYDGELSILQSRPYFLEITDKRATKGQALRWVAEREGIKAEEVLAFGDGYNDLDMLDYAGLGVAVANAKPEVLKAAALVTAPHDEDGVAEIIEKYVLNHRPAPGNNPPAFDQAGDQREP